MRNLIQPWMAVVVVLLTTSPLLATPTPTSANCTWTVEGTLQVDHMADELNDAFGDRSELKNVEVKVSARSRSLGVWGTWAEWETKRTSSSGFFQVQKERSCDQQRRFRVEVRFRDADLEVRHETSTSSLTKVKWFRIHNDDSGGRTKHTLNLGTLTFGPTGAEDLNDAEARDHADVWVGAKTIIDKFDLYGPEFEFDKPVKIKVRHNSWVAGDDVEASYVNPITKIAYLFRSNDGTEDHLRDQGMAVLSHEMAHQWMYAHSSGEADLAVNLLASGSTHCFEPEQVAFAEGVAEFMSEQLLRILFDQEAPRPFNRDALNAGLACEGADDRILNLDKMSEHEYGWMSAMRLLMQENLFKQSFEGSPVTTNRNDESTWIQTLGGFVVGCPEPPAGFVFKKIVGVFLPDGPAGYSHELKKSEMSIEPFYDRAAAILGIKSKDKDMLLDFLDPSSDIQPRDYCGNISLSDEATGPQASSHVEMEGPNPFDGRALFRMESERAVPAHLEIFDLQGKRVLERSYPVASGARRIEIDLGGQPSGMYVWLVRLGSDMISGKMIKVAG